MRQLLLFIDATAGTPLTQYDGTNESIAHLRCDITNMAHHIRSNANVFVIGAGGGRDVLTALLFEQQSVTAVELNGNILDIVNNTYGNFTGHLDERPEVTFVNDEARSYITRSDDRFDIIQLSFIDTWAATAAGAFALSENSLYTIEAWKIFLDHLTPNGVFSVSRWFYGDRPMEAYRVTSLASAALREIGVENPREHIIFLKSQPNQEIAEGGVGVGTILISREPFSDEDVFTIGRIANEYNFEVALTPDAVGSDPLFAEIAEASDPGSIDLGFPADISAPTDDKPFFFQMFHVRDMFNPDVYDNVDPILTKPVVVLFSLVITVIALTTLFILFPLALTTSRQALRGMAPFVVFFCGIGFGFLLLEVAQLQRLIIFLGHPTYALSVLLFSLLIFSGIGSLATDRLVAAKPSQLRHLWPLPVLLAVLVVFGLITPAATHAFDAETTPVRIALSVLILAPMGLFMGMPFPLGMKVASRYDNAPTAFFWGVNGATSVCASVLAVAIALGWGISMSFWVGSVCYLIAAIALAVVARRRV